MKVALVGNQNSGKTTLFNLLTGMNAKIGNWPGVTIEKKSGIIKSSQNNGVVCEITDLPGIYSLSPYSVEEEVSRRFIFDESPDVIVNIIDANCLERSLYLTTQLLELDCRVIVVLNMVDLLEKKGLSIDEHKLEALLGTSVIKVSALKGDGVDELLKEMFYQPSSIKKVNSLYIYDAKLEQAIVDIQSNLLLSKHKRFVAVKLLENDFRFNSNDLEISDSKFSQIQRIRDNLATEYDTDLEEIIATERYGFIEQVKPKVVHGIVQVDNLMSIPSISDKLDSIFLNKWLAIPIFIVIMFLVYYLSAGVIGKFTVDFIEDIVEKAKEKGKITYGELATELGDINPEQIDKVFDAFEEMGVDVLKDDFDEEPDVEELEKVEDIKVEDINKIASTAKKIKAIDGVDIIKYGEGMVEQLVAVFDVVRKICLGMVVALIVVTAFLISNTIKITIFSRKREIEIMRLVGASNLNIKIPFIFEGLFLGVIGSIIPIIATIYGYTVLFENFNGQLFSPFIKLVEPQPFIFLLSLVLVVIGILVGMFGSWRAVKKYLKI